MADDDQWAEDYDRWDSGDADSYGKAAYKSYYDGHGSGGSAGSKANGAGYMGKSGSDWDAWGRDQDLHIKESYDDTQAKSYSAESYDEWDNSDGDKWGAQAWGKDRDVYGASSYGKAASAGAWKDYQTAPKGGYGYGHQGYGDSGSVHAKAATSEYGAAKGGYDNDQWAKLAHGSDYDSRWGKSYDRVSARSYDNTEYAKWL